MWYSGQEFQQKDIYHQDPIVDKSQSTSVAQPIVELNVAENNTLVSYRTQILPDNKKQKLIFHIGRHFDIGVPS
jgi:hypothetical protein